MARLLLAWELGTGFGHAAPLAQLAERLLERGHDVDLAWQDLSLCAAVLPGLIGHPRLHQWQAPICTGSRSGLADPASFPEMLLCSGLGDVDRLLESARGWRQLFDAIQPDLLVADHAPTALLAARGRPMRVATFGNAFLIPPALAPMPVFRDWEAVDAVRLAASEARLLTACNVVLAALGEPPMTAVRELLRVDEQFLLGWPELDHYRPLRESPPSPCWGWPPPPRVAAAPASWPADHPGRRLLVYLRHDHPAIETVLAVLRAGPWASLVHLVRADDAATSQVAAGGVVIVNRLLDLSSTLADADLLVSHAGSGTVYAALQAGVPTLLLPTHAEQLMLARRVAATGAGVLMWPDEVGTRFAGALSAMLGSPGFAAAARALAARQAIAPADVLPRIVERCEALSAQAR
ncbi:nucleotide disphospho-sugar-binding domain-containing protein [Piscinibacter sakaiensis]|uniref:nucleotide disphospho-sugar-binding domain-containing protein n=1 Tax=Piscinibacter sakaiensis TaxID=1547922 RepID=UPI003AAEB423